MERVVVTRPFIGVFAMGVCAVNDATDEEILKVCNDQNPSGTSNGWGTVVRTEADLSDLVGKNCLPVKCSDDDGRTRFIILC